MRFSNTRMKVLTLGATSVLALAIAGAAAAEEAARHNVDIEAQKLASALLEFSEQSDVLVAFPPELVNGRQAPAVKGDLTTEDALGKLLQGSGLNYSMGSDGGVTILQTAALQEEGRRERGFLRLAQADVQSDGSVNDRSVPAEMQTDTIIVTATKREQNLQDVASSISVLGADEISRRSIVSQSDFLNSVPGVSFVSPNVGLGQIVIRGIAAAREEQATVSTYLGEIPLTPTIAETGAGNEIKLVDIERVEVLRGPQGTLYGSGALGGTVRYIPKAPNLSEVEGGIELGIGKLSRSEDTNSSISGYLSVPLVEDRLAVRVAAYEFNEGGYVDRISTPRLESLAATTGTTVEQATDLGDASYRGVRVSLLFQATDRARATVTLGTQKLEQDGSLIQSLALGEFNFDELQEADPLFEDTLEYGNLVLDLDFGWAGVVSSTNYYKSERTTQRDASGFGLGASLQDLGLDWEGIAQEVRLTSQFESPLQFIAGFYYEDFDSTRLNRIEWIGTDSSLDDFFGFDVADPVYGLVENTRELQQTAVFGEIEYQILPTLSATFGARWFDYEREDMTDQFVFAQAPISMTQTDESGTNLKASVSFKPTENAHFYAQWAEGFRVGQGQLLPPAATCDADGDGFLDTTDAPFRSSVDSDRTDNYELGGKLSLFDNQLSVNASVYRIDWQDIPILVRETSATCLGNQGLIANAGEARSQGVEVDAAWNATSNLQFFLSASYKESEFTQDFGTTASEGDPLPLSPDFNGRIGLEYELDQFAIPAFLRTDYTYVGGFDTFVNIETPEAGDYGLWNARVGTNFNGISIEAFINNITNEDGITVTESADLVFRNRPRMFGVEVGYDF